MGFKPMVQTILCSESVTDTHLFEMASHGESKNQDLMMAVEGW